jgi:hypothetical protein
MNEERERERIGLSERWTKIATILPNSISSHSNHPSLMVDPSGFRRVVKTSLVTCNRFLEMLQKVEDGLEKRIPGITSYYGLVVAPHRQSQVVRDYGGVVSVSGRTITLSENVFRPDSGYVAAAPTLYKMSQSQPQPQSQSQSQPQPQSQSQSQPESPKETGPISKASIFQKVGNYILRNDHKLGDDEVISFNRGLEILSKLDNLRDVSTDCITTLGALEEVLALGKLFSYRYEDEYNYTDPHQVKITKTIREDMMPLQSYWGTLTCVNRIRTVQKKLSAQLKDI